MTPPVKTLIMNIVTGVLVLGALAIGYFVFIKKKTETVAPEAAAPALGVAQTVAVSSEISRTKTELSELKKSVAASVEVFSSREFRSLQDFSIQVPEEPIGRENPFVPTDWKLKMKALEAAASKKGTSSGSSAPVGVTTKTGGGSAPVGI